MKIIEYFTAQDKEYWLKEIKKSDWGAGQFLHQLLSENRLREMCGERTVVYLLVEDRKLVSFCTLAEQDDVRNPEYTPWIGFVYTFPDYRGHRYVGRLIKLAEEQAKAEGNECIYISTGETGLYEKYGYDFYKIMKDMNGEDSRVYRKAIGN